MQILISGSHGFLGSALAPFLTAQGHQVAPLTRPYNPAALDGIDALVHLAGENIFGRWTPGKKATIRDSRVDNTRLLAESIARLSPKGIPTQEGTRPPRTFVCASAIGFYGDRADELLQEASGPGTGFLAEVCQAWEAAAQPAIQRGIRVVHLRSGMVLSPQGGALAKMLPPFRAGLGGRLGNGRQYMSWISLEDWLEAAAYVLEHPALRGPVNFVAPQPVTNRDFTKTLGRVLGRPTICPVPGFALRLLLGEMADELLLSSARATPAALLASGFSFRHPELEGALHSMLSVG